MYYFQINRAKTLKGLCLLAVSICIIASQILNIYAEQALTYGNYPVLRGQTNPQEIEADYKISDSGTNLRQMMLANRLGIFKTENNNIYPNRQLTNLDTIKALTALSGNNADITEKNDTEATYRTKAIEQGFITEEELSKEENEKFFENKTTMRQLNNYFSKVMNKETKYDTSVGKIATRLDLANMIYENKEEILKKQDISLYTGQIVSKSQIVEEGKNKSLISVKLDRNIVIDKAGTTTSNNENNQNAQNQNSNQEYANNDVEKIIEDNANDSTVASYINIISQRDVPILTPSGFTTNVNNIWEQSQVNIYSKNNSVLYIEQFNVPTNEIVGVFESIIKENKELLNDTAPSEEKTPQNTSEIIKIKDYDGTAHIYKMHPDVKIMQVNGEIGAPMAISKPVSKDQLSYGQDVRLTVRNAVVTIIEAYVPVEEELNSYVPAESQLSGGTVLDVTEGSLTLTNNMTYSIGPDTLIMKNGEISDYRQIKDGDRIKLFFDDIYSNIPSKIEIEGNQRQADRIIKAKVGPYSIASKSLTLKDAKELQNGQWTDISENAKAYENIKIRGDIYANSAKVESSRLKNYNNQEIYAVLAKNQGVPTIEKGKIRIGDSLKFDSSISNIDYSQNTLQIDGNLVKFDDSTIIVKDGNIVQSGNLEKNINSNIETNIMKSAQIIVQTGASLNIDNVRTYPYKIYRATLRDVYDYSILLGNDIEKGRKVNHYFMWQGGVWNRLSEGKTTPRLNFTEQTKVYDFDNNKALSIEQLREKQHSLNEFGIRADYFNRQVYVVTKDDVVISINFIKSEGYVQVNSQNLIVAKGVGEYSVESNENSAKDSSTEKAIKPVLVKNIYEYNSSTNRLQPISPIVTTNTSTQEIKKTPVRKLINLEKASLISNGKVISKTSADALKDKNLTIVFKQNRDKKTTDNIEELDAILVIAE